MHITIGRFRKIQLISEVSNDGQRKKLFDWRKISKDDTYKRHVTESEHHKWRMKAPIEGSNKLFIHLIFSQTSHFVPSFIKIKIIFLSLLD